MKLTALQPIRHDGKRYAPGDSLNVKSKAQAQALIDCGSAEAGEAADSDDKSKTEDAGNGAGGEG